jgi:hypothetical protein
MCKRNKGSHLQGVPESIAELELPETPSSKQLKLAQTNNMRIS